MPSYFAKPPKGAVLNRSHPLAGGLVAAYLFNEGGGLKLYDAAGRTNQTATATGTPTWTSGPVGKVVKCGTSGQLFTAGANPLNGSAVFSVSAWVNSSSSAFANAKYATCDDSGGTGDGWFLGIDGNSPAKFNFSKRKSFSAATATANSGLTANKWTHLVGTVNAAGLITLYVDGIAQTTTGTKTGSFTNTNSLTILGGTHSGSFINQQTGLLIWKNRCLTDRDVQQLYADSFAMFRRQYVPDIIHSTGGGSDAVGTATGTSTASGVGGAASASVASASGTCAVSAVGSAASASVASGSGTCTVAAAGASAAASVASASGTCTVSGVSGGGASSTGSASGTCTVSGTGISSSASVGSAAGTSTVSGVGNSATSGASVGTASGTSTASAVGASAVAAIFSAIGTCTVNGISPSASFSQNDPASFFTMGDGVSSIGGGDRPSTISVSSGFSFFGM